MGSVGDRIVLGRRERGAAAIEFALILPVFVMLVFGMFTGGIAYNQKQQLTHAAREGSRYGAVLPLAQFGTAAGWVDNVEQQVISRAAGDLDPGLGGTVCVAVVEGNPAAVMSTALGSYSSTGAPCFDDGGADAEVRVQVLVEKPATINAILVRSDVTIASRSVTRYESET